MTHLILEIMIHRSASTASIFVVCRTGFNSREKSNEDGVRESDECIYPSKRS